MPNKALAGGATGAVTVILVWAFGAFGLAIPGEVASAITTLLATLVVYLVPHEGGNNG